ncbi:MAG TPA: hypothetical protein VKY57_13555 [Chitinispirillaceae bacterium]|nr:hypothetical protein [Chitinispirillaceae bacterium]
MRFGQRLNSDSVLQMDFPAFQPLRLWTQKRESVHKQKSVKQLVGYNGSGSTREFCMKGGFMNVSGKERRLVIAGKIFRS